MRKQIGSMSIFLFSLFVASATVVSAATPTTTPSDDDSNKSDDTSLQENIKERLKKVVDDKKDQVKGVSTSGEKRGFVATVKRVSEETLTVETRKGTQIITVDENLSIVQDGKAFKLSNIEVDSQVVVMGYQNGEDFEARRILVLKKPLQSFKKSIEVGTVKKIDKLSIQITTRAGEDKSFSLSPKLVVEDNTGEEIKLGDVEVDQDVLLITVPDDENAKTVKESSGRVIRLHSLVSADATPKADEKPTPKVTGKTTPTKTPTKAVTKAPSKTPTEPAQ